MGKTGVRILGMSVIAAVMTGLIGNLVAGSRLIFILLFPLITEQRKKGTALLR